MAGDTNGRTDIFVKDLTTGALTRVSEDAAGNEGNNLSRDAIFSPDGTQVVFESNASNLVAGDTNEATDVFIATLTEAFTGPKDTAIALPITVSATEPDDTLSTVTLSGLPVGSTLSEGTDVNGDGTAWAFTGAPSADLTLTPPAGFSGSFTLTVTAITVDATDTETTTATQEVTVTPEAEAAGAAEAAVSVKAAPFNFDDMDAFDFSSLSVGETDAGALDLFEDLALLPAADVPPADVLPAVEGDTFDCACLKGEGYASQEADFFAF